MFMNRVSLFVVCPYCKYECSYEKIMSIGTELGTLTVECIDCGRELLKVETNIIKPAKIKEGVVYGKREV